MNERKKVIKEESKRGKKSKKERIRNSENVHEWNEYHERYNINANMHTS